MKAERRMSSLMYSCIGLHTDGLKDLPRQCPIPNLKYPQPSDAAQTRR